MTNPFSALDIQQPQSNTITQLEPSLYVNQYSLPMSSLLGSPSGSLAASLCSGVRLCLYAVCRQCTETFHILDNQRLFWHTNPLRLSSHRILFPQAQTCTTVEDFLHFHWNEEVNIFLHCQKKKNVVAQTGPGKCTEVRCLSKYST